MDFCNAPKIVTIPHCATRCLRKYASFSRQQRFARGQTELGGTGHCGHVMDVLKAALFYYYYCSSSSSTRERCLSCVAKAEKMWNSIFFKSRLRALQLSVSFVLVNCFISQGKTSQCTVGNMDRFWLIKKIVKKSWRQNKFS